MKYITLIFLFTFGAFQTIAQNSVKGTIVDNNGNGLNDVVVSVDKSELSTITDENGMFSLENIDSEKITLTFSKEGWNNFSMDVDFSETKNVDLDKIKLTIVSDNNIPILTLSETDLEDENDFENVSGLLTASRDIFSNAAAFNFGVARFRVRGYDSNTSEIYINGSSMNDLETGRTFWSAWGGLNDVFRNREATLGLNPGSFAFGGINGATNIDIGASSQRKQKRISYASSNRSYRHRIMGVYTPKLKNDWFLTLSGSRRWAQEGYVEGTFYDAWSYFFGVEKKFGQQSLAFNIFGAPNKRGRASASTQEMYDIAGTNYYNPNWGYQEGEKRNARVANAHQPIAILQHKLNLKKNTSLNTSLSYQFGRNGSTRLDWNNARDPRPDYYRYLPSYVENAQTAQMVWDAMAANEGLRQLDWTYMYNTNGFSDVETIENVDGRPGNTVTGLRSKYVIEESRYDKQKADANINFNTLIGENVTLNSGVYYRWQKTRNHKVLNDLLGGDFFLDIDRFSERDFPDNPEVLQNDLNNPNKIVREGDSYGYDYDGVINKAGVWLQTQINLDKVDLFVAANGSQTNFWRDGKYVNGRFPDNSFGKSEVQKFMNYGVKLGSVYKINGRNYLFANASYLTTPPSYRNAYLSPRTRDQVAPNLTSEKIVSTEGGYYLKSPYYKARVTGYFTQFKDGIRTMSFYHDGEQAFVNYTLTGIDKKHFGIELAGEAQIVTGLSINAVAAIGQYIYNSRPLAYITQDNDSELLADGQTIYQKNFYIPGTPQQAYSFGLRYNSPKFWFANVSVNLFNEMYLDFNPDRRTAAAVEPITYGSDEWTTTINQERLDPQVTMDLFGGKSWRFDYKYYIYLTVGVSNALNNRQFITGGFEQLRFDGEDINKFPNRYYYAYGINYFAQIAFRF